MARRGRKPKREVQMEQTSHLLKGILTAVLLVGAVISLLAIFVGYTDTSGVLDAKLRVFLVNALGLASVCAPMVLFYTALYTIKSIHGRIINTRGLIGILLFSVSFAGMLGESAGTIGAAIRLIPAPLISIPGAAFLYFSTMLIGIMLIFNVGIHNNFGPFSRFFTFIKEKLLRVAPPVDETEEADDVELLSVDASHVAPPAQYRPDGEIIEDAAQLSLEDERKLHEDNDFVLVHPPSGPVSENGENDAMSAALDTPRKKEEKVLEKPAGKLPFSNTVWEYPPLELLAPVQNKKANAGNTQERARTIEDTLKAFGIRATIAHINIGPAVTQYAISLPVGTKASKVQTYAMDLALRLQSPSGSVRVEAPIPGTNLVGIEVPNYSPSTVSLRSVLQSEEMKRNKDKLTIALGHDVAGKPVVQSISKWPHCLVAGSTGSGKSVMLNAIIATLLYRCSPQECKFIMVDPKMVELSQYNGIPHLLIPVVTDIEQKAVSAFAWAVSEMDRRYKLFASAGVRNIEAYNELSGFQAEPYIMIVVDELADMMMVAASEVEKYITRLAQKSRAVGIHLILATQRPSVNILTGTIKANIPTRMSFKVTSQVDSRVIIDQIGAETLIGRGDMLFVPPTDSKPRRLQGVFVSDKEISDIVEFLKSSGVEPEYKTEIFEQKVSASGGMGGNSMEGQDEKMAEALEIVLTEGQASASRLQRKLGLGYSRAARLIDQMEDAGIIGGQRGSKPREVLMANFDEAMMKLSGGSE